MIDREIMQGMLRQIVGLLHMIPTEDMEEYVQGVSANNSLYDAVGAILDPTDYRDTLHSGKRDNVRVELQIAEKLVEIRKLIDTLKPVKAKPTEDEYQYRETFTGFGIGRKRSKDA